MTNDPKITATRPRPRRTLRRWLAFGCALGCGGLLFLFVALIGAAFLFLRKVPQTYPPVSEPITPPAAGARLGGGLDGFDSPYLGHTGSWNGKGGGLGGGSKIADLDIEKAMGLRWTFMPVYWKALEPDGPVDLSQATPPAWQALDAFVIAAHQRGLNVLMQVVVGGNAGGPPRWAGRRDPGKSAPENMDALADFAGKLAARYRPGGTLATREGWGNRYGVRAWEMDNEPEMYLTNWKGQAADYAEFVTKAAALIKRADADAVIVAPGIAGGSGHGPDWIVGALDAEGRAGSPTFRSAGKAYSIGPVTDAVSFHLYEGLDTAFSGRDRTIERAFSETRAVFEEWEKRAPGFDYARKQEYWHTEGNFDFLGVMSAKRRAAWRWQFYSRAFAAGIRKVIVMDPSKAEQAAMRAYVRVLPNPFPMLRTTNEISVLRGQAMAFRHSDDSDAQAGRVWVVWALADTGDATVEIPVLRERVEVLEVESRSSFLTATGGRVRLELKGDAKMAPPVIVVDRPVVNGREERP